MFKACPIFCNWYIYMNKRLLSVLIFAFLVSAGASVALYQLISSRVTVNANAKAPSVQVLVAARNLDIGSLIKDADFKMVEWPGALPTGAIVKKEDAVGRGVIIAIYDGEPIIESRLAPKGAGAGLAANIKPGMRAVALRVNDVNGLAGFVIPGMHVDVLISGTPPNNPNPNAGAVAKTLLQNIEILSAGQNIQKDAEGKPVVVNLVNVLVTPDQAEILNLATNDTRVQLVLRNPIDHETAVTKGAWLQELYTGSIPKGKAVGRRAAPPRDPLPQPAAAPPKPDGPFVLEIINGTHRTETVFEK
jgi:pilus assembly protein CpaB